MAHRITRHLLAALLLGAATVASAQRAPLAVAPAWRPPVLHVAGAEQPVRLQRLGIDVDAGASLVRTRVRMEFFNPNGRSLEGKLDFPLADGQVVSGFALDVEGQLRDAVPIEKARGEQVFEDIARRGVDPGLLQATAGNNYQLRVYPLPPGKTRTVVLTLVEPARARLQLPLGYADRVDALELTLRYPAARGVPTIAGADPLGVVFRKDAHGGWSAALARTHARLPRQPLLVQSSARDVAATTVTTERRNGSVWFSVDLAVANEHAPRPLPKQVQIVWDASGSAANRRIDREFALLDAYFRRAGTIAVSLVRVSDTAAAPERYAVRGGDWSALRRALQATRYDGASQLGAVRHDGVSGEALWFSDGLANYGAPWRLAFPVPVFAVNSAGSANVAALRALAEASGGRAIDLSRVDDADAAAALLTRSTRLERVDAVGAGDIVVESHDAASGRLSLAGRLTDIDATLVLALRRADGRLVTQRIQVEADQGAAQIAGLQWARLELASLEGDAHGNKTRIREIGQRFGLATRETSLIVLEQVDDYVRHGVEPPVALREAYERLAATAAKRRLASDAERIERVVHRFETRAAWWSRDFPKDELPPRVSAKSAPPQLSGALGRAQSAERRERANATGGARQDELARSARPLAAAPAAAQAPARDGPAREAKKDGGSAGTGTPDIAIALKPAAMNAPEVLRLQAAAPDEWHAIYADARRGNTMSVGFFLDAAEFFLQHNKRALGLRVLSNLAEMDLQNRQVLRLLAYRLQQAGESGLAVPIFERVLELAPGEPQSHRDLGLALAQAGDAQRAVDELYAVVTGAWSPRFADIDLIALAELNAIVAQARLAEKAVDTSAIDSRLLKNLPLDVRVVLAWDADNTDVDLHVIDPNGDEVYYGRALSYQGGAITRDATGGYGPEEFALRLAKPGKYTVVANFFGHRQQVLASGTGLMLWFSSGFGTPQQVDRRTTLRVKSERGERVVVGEFEVKS
ncbi:MAG: VIT domain-containing protein [Caldimonas sp.]